MHRRTFVKASAAMSMFGSSAQARSDAFFVPAEEHPHELTFLQWPVSRKVHRDPVFLGMLQDTIADIANAVVEFEPVIVLVDAQHHEAARRKLNSAVELWDISTEDLWARDSGPIGVIDGRGNRAIRHIQFNGWGKKQVHRHDGKIAERVAAELGLPLLPSQLKGEAGGVEQDGHGLLMAHESSWVIGNRNPGLSRQAVEDALLDAYGADRMIWAPGVKNEDITDYHIDSLARFTGPGRVLINLPDDPDMDDTFHRAALQTTDILQEAGLEVEIIPEPNRRRVKSFDFVASYANYYVCNGAVIMAQFGDSETDAIAQDAIRRHYPGRAIITLNADALGEVGGGIHCATHELPKA